MPRAPIRSIAVVGDGPAGCTLATLLARGGRRVVLFSAGRPEGLVVGESLVPAVVPILRELGIEEEVRAYARLKPGASFYVDPDFRFEIDFAGVCRRVPGYAYNVPRDRFDASLMEACRRSGVEIVEARARLEPTSPPGEAPPGLGLARESLEAAGWRQAPDLVVDASGRARLGARILDLPTRLGERRDTALFAHCSGVRLERTGDIHSDRLERGWCWRIPLPGRVSLGIVVAPELLRELGASAEEQYDAFLASEPRLQKLAGEAKRLSSVVRYSNYQLTTLRGVGPGWALVGDAFGFVDPVFSSGLFLAMEGARELAAAIAAGSPSALRRYERRQLRHIEAWRRAVGYFYDGRFFALFRLGQQPQTNAIARLINPFLSRHLPRVFTGEGTQDRYESWLLDFMAERAGRAPDVADLAISS